RHRRRGQGRQHLRAAAGWLVAVGIRLATGSATGAPLTAAGIVAPLAEGMQRPEVALLVLAIGAGSLFFSHVNDAGFWLVKEYFGMTVGQTIKTWSIMETIISVVGLVVVLLLNLVLLPGHEHRDRGRPRHHQHEGGRVRHRRERGGQRLERLPAG